jgi:CheY-like chemotaxis protein
VSILIIDDDESAQECVAHLLRGEGFAVEFAADGQEALDRLARDPLPELILLDLMMPGMDGIEFRERQLADARLAAIPVIVISAQLDAMTTARALGAEDYLPKPLSLDELLHVVQNRAITAVFSEP